MEAIDSTVKAADLLADDDVDVSDPDDDVDVRPRSGSNHLSAMEAMDSAVKAADLLADDDVDVSDPDDDVDVRPRSGSNLFPGLQSKSQVVGDELVRLDEQMDIVLKEPGLWYCVSDEVLLGSTNIVCKRIVGNVSYFVCAVDSRLSTESGEILSDKHKKMWHLKDDTVILVTGVADFVDRLHVIIADYAKHHKGLSPLELLCQTANKVMITFRNMLQYQGVWAKKKNWGWMAEKNYCVATVFAVSRHFHVEDAVAYVRYVIKKEDEFSLPYFRVEWMKENVMHAGGADILNTVDTSSNIQTLVQSVIAMMREHAKLDPHTGGTCHFCWGSSNTAWVFGEEEIISSKKHSKGKAHDPPSPEGKSAKKKKGVTSVLKSKTATVFPGIYG